MNPLKLILYILGITILISDIYLYFFYYFNLYIIEFTLIRWVFHISIIVILNGILYLSAFRNIDKNIKVTAGIFFCLEVIMMVYNYKRNDLDLKNNGKYIVGYVIDKEKQRNSWDVVYNFKINGQIYKSELGISERSEIEKISIGDSAKIKYSEIHPKINEVVKKY